MAGPWSYDLTLLGQPVVTPNDARHYPHVVDELALNASLTTLQVQDSTHAHTSDSGTLLTWIVLTTSESGTTYYDEYDLVWGTTYIYRVTDASGNVLTSEEVTFYGLPMYGASHGHTVENVDLPSMVPSLIVADCSHAQSVENLTLTGIAYSGTSDEATHAHTSEQVTLTGLAYSGTADEASHAHTVEAPTLTSHAVLSVQDASHVLSSHHLVWLPTPYPAHTTHGHTADDITLDFAVAALLVDDAYHSILAENPDLTVEITMAGINDARHTHAADRALMATISHAVGRVHGSGSNEPSTSGLGGALKGTSGETSHTGSLHGTIGVY